MDWNPATTPVANWLDQPSKQRVREITEFLTAQGTFRFPKLRSGLFSAAGFEQHGSESTGYHNAWTRDAVHIAHACWVLGDVEAARNAVAALSQFYIKTQSRFENIIKNPSLAADPMKRPHIRFDGDHLVELTEKWAHAQNDALGYWLWLTCQMLLADQLPFSQGLSTVLGTLVRYWAAIEYWHDEDSGHWEETRKIEASSIGVVVASLKLFNQVVQQYPEQFSDQTELPALIDELLTSGETALHQILPFECIEGDHTQRRAHDAALLFLIYPLHAVDRGMGVQIVDNVLTHLQGPIGIRRYLGDSYWCANYKTLLTEETRTGDFSEALEKRDALLAPGTEAQWCIFDPIVSIIFGQRYLDQGQKSDLEQQLEHARRSLLQLTPPTSRFGPWRCPESYYLEGDEWVPNDITPLLWTQANLRLALFWLEQTLD
ncbi:MAG: phosphorylase kinase [Planctomycetaceae bacterium]|nr:phosphorylase kinase [Planctomycetaceae bacterium]